MRYKILVLFLVAILGLSCNTSQAASAVFILDGNAGLGLLGGNENPAVTGGGTGGLGTGGITLDTLTNLLSIDVVWGQKNPEKLTGVVAAMHIHLPTANPAPAGFSDNVGPVVTLHTLAGMDPATKGGFLGSVTLSASEATALLDNKAYINVHTSLNPGGEIRGHLVTDFVIPEPGTLTLLALSMFMVGTFRCKLS